MSVSSNILLIYSMMGFSFSLFFFLTYKATRYFACCLAVAMIWTNVFNGVDTPSSAAQTGHCPYTCMYSTEDLSNIVYVYIDCNSTLHFLIVALMNDYDRDHLSMRFWKVEPTPSFSFCLNCKAIAWCTPGVLLTNVDSVFEVKI